MTTYGFIGAGNMAGAIVEGMVAAGRSAEVLVWSAHGSAAALAERTGVALAASGPDLVALADVVVLAVKPHVVPTVLAGLQEALDAARPLVVSVAAGLSTSRLESLLPDGARVVRAMPNMAAGVRESMTALATGAAASQEDLEAVAGLMSEVGSTMVLAEKDFSAFIALAGSSPAFVFTFVEALARAGVEAGIPKAQAVEIVAQAVLGSARTVQVEARRRRETGQGRTPADLVDAVCSPGGTTVAGVVAMERAGFSSALIEGARATRARDLELS
ncbi:pyrroline-5-carboxylate reductase [Actinomyces howellii]|uniref:Pyrroline-5-carboxylate reductase n=1 Tax=Actinomyces howellii TaxID=52771 RepID=A0A448HFC4_9ACTO|nr:pyrroline-5-carboxylate reductase [Actinomyces howellii]VEG27029.1 Pyrroline-5-carboxylate reductase [Actinomyces howellii]